MANFPIENFYTGYHVTSGLYSTGYADGSLQAQIQQNLGQTSSCQALNTPFWQSLMSTQNNLFAGWSGFCGCPAPQPQPQPQPPQQGQHCGRQRVDIEVYHHFYENGCGGPFTCNQSQGASSTSQSYSAFGSCGCNLQNIASGCSYTPFNSYTSFGFGSHGLYGCAPNPTGYQSTYRTDMAGYQGQYGNPYGDYQGCYGNPYGTYQGSYGNPYGTYQGSYGNPYGTYQGSYGNPGGAYQGCYGNPYGSYQGSYSSSQGGYQGSYGSSYGGYQGSYGSSYSAYGGSFGACNNTYGLPQSLPTYNWGDFNYSFGGNNNSAFGVLPSSYASYAMTSPFTDFGTAAGIATLGGALSLLF